MFSVFKNSRTESGELRKARSRKIAVIDTETTGVYPKRDRVIEVAVVLADWSGNIEEKFVTLINPNRDLGDTNIHRIKASDVHDAPGFSEIAGDVAERLKDRVVVGHNIPFDLRMLSLEFDRISLPIPSVPNLCTLRLAYKLGPSSRNLRDCCSYVGVNAGQWHSALDDAIATYELLMKYLERSESFGGFEQFENHAFDPGDLEQNWPTIACSGRQKMRGVSTEVQVHPYLANITSRLPDPGSLDLASYYLLLDRALDDRILSSQELSDLSELAVQEGLDREALVAAHHHYLDDVVLVALQDGVISEREHKDLLTLAGLLGISAAVLEQRIEFCKEHIGEQTNKSSTSDRNCLKGSKICFTGSLTCKIDGKIITRELAEKIAIENGLEVVSGVSKKTDILIVADPHTMSGKAKKAREYGTRILAEDVFWRMLDISVE